VELVARTGGTHDKEGSIWESALSLSPVAPSLEHMESVKPFVSLQFLYPKTVGRTPWAGDQTGHYLHTE
jgi:hypothetical protein